MNINFTLVVQAINFLIAYVLINKLLLRPVINLINKEEEIEKNTNFDMVKAKEELEETQNIKLQKWQKFQKKFSKDSPDVFGFFLENLIDKTKKTITIKDVDTSKIRSKERELKEYLIKKVENV